VADKKSALWHTLWKSAAPKLAYGGEPHGAAICAGGAGVCADAACHHAQSGQAAACGTVFAFRGRRAGLIKLIWHDGVGLCMLTKRLEQGHFAWPCASTTGKIALSSAQLAALLDGCDTNPL